MPCSFSFVLPRSPNRYGLVQKSSSAAAYGTGAAFAEKSAAYTAPLNSDEKAIPTPHAHAMFTNLRNIFLVLPPSQALCLLASRPCPKPSSLERAPSPPRTAAAAQDGGRDRVELIEVAEGARRD